MKFHILKKGDCGHWHICHSGGNPLLFDNPALATETAKRLTQDIGKPHRIQALQAQDDTAWHDRERNRFKNGDYETPPWDNRFVMMISLGNERFPHMSKKQSGKIAYTQNADKGARDLQTNMSVGRYLKKYHGWQLRPEIIADLSALCGETGFEIVTQTKDIVAAYIDGPRSCMSGNADSFQSNPHHPCEVYGGASDLALAILRRDGEITARAIVWPARGIYSTIYGDSSRLRAELHERNYGNHDNMSGARLNKISCGDDGHVCAYLDGERRIAIHADYLEIGGSDAIADSVEGTLSSGETCCNCDCSIDEDCAMTTDDGEVYCEECYYEIYSHCENCEDTHYSDDMIWIESAQTNVCPYCADAHYPSCDNCNERSPSDDMLKTRDGEDLCSDCFCESHTTCESCYEAVPNDEVKATPNGDYHCEECYKPPTDDDSKPKPSPNGSPTINDPRQKELNL
jgi:hypothetical protein